MIYVDRTCSEVVAKAKGAAEGQKQGKPLCHYADCAAWVLLGPAGAGKTEAFKREAKDTEACYVTARDFIALNRDDWCGKTLFIDALDEVRAGAPDGRTPLDQIRTKLEALEHPKFRISCREADWFGTDRADLKAVSPDGSVLALHLDPLTDEQVKELLQNHSDVPDTDAFLRDANEAGLRALLQTPQGVELLAKAAAGGERPKTRRDTFELACRRLASEQDDRHVQATRHDFNIEVLLEAAGKLCAIQLLTGNAGYAAKTAKHPSGYIPLRDIPSPSQAHLGAALHTRLFIWPADQCAEPMHRQIAEFIAARHIAGLIRAKKLPPKRVLALMTGKDGGVVSTLRGLSAWLAAHSDAIRPDCIERDPLGVILYGDVKRFDTDTKRLLINGIKEQAKRDPWILHRGHELDTRWGDLATPDAEQLFREVLNAPGRDDAGQSLAEALLVAMRHSGAPLVPDELLMDIARDGERWPQARGLALESFIRQAGEKEQSVGELFKLLHDVEAGVVSDPLDSLLGILLARLYPTHIAPSDVCQYLREPRKPMLLSYYKHFWRYGVLERSTEEQLSEVLDGLVHNWSDWKNEPLARDCFSRVMMRLLKGSMQVDAQRLFGWLVVMEKTRNVDETKKVFVEWLKKNPERYKELVAVATEHDAEATTMRRFEGHRALQERQQLMKKQDDASTAQTAAWPQEQQEQVSLDKQVRQRRAHWQSSMRENEAAILDNCPVEVLSFLAGVYWGEYVDVEGETPIARLRYLLEDDALVELALKALRDTPNRKDLPNVGEAAAAGWHSIHPFTWPFLAAMELLASEPVAAPPLDEDGMRLALAFLFRVPIEPPDWYASLLKTRPELVADTLVEYSSVAFRHGNVSTFLLHKLANDPAHDAVARLAIMGVLDLFPPRNAGDLGTLRELLSAALKYAPDSELTALIERKLALPRSPSQRVHWLCCGLTLGLSGCFQPLDKALAGRAGQRHVQSVVELMHDGVLRVHNLDIEVVVLLFETIASRHPPDSGLVPGSSAIHAPNAVEKLLVHLASQTTPAAKEALDKLAAKEGLHRWEPELRHARTRQQEARREAAFRHATVEEVLNTLDNDLPANAADLAALATDHFTTLGRRIRDGNTSDWRQYWNKNKDGGWTHCYENECRDRLLSGLRPMLPEGVMAEPEGPYADGCSADIRPSCNGFNVPVEIKCSDSDDLWSAINKQLIPKYTRDPGADGHGIYLVLWFGREGCRKPPKAPAPSSAQELEAQLRESLTAGEARRISVIVIDVSKPPSKG